LWAICGSAVHGGKTSRMVVQAVFDMPLMADEVLGFYPKM
jgi:predicted membrane protein